MFQFILYYPPLRQQKGSISACLIYSCEPSLPSLPWMQIQTWFGTTISQWSDFNNCEFINNLKGLVLYSGGTGKFTFSTKTLINFYKVQSLIDFFFPHVLIKHRRTMENYYSLFSKGYFHLYSTSIIHDISQCCSIGLLMELWMAGAS